MANISVYDIMDSKYFECFCVLAVQRSLFKQSSEVGSELLSTRQEIKYAVVTLAGLQGLGQRSFEV